MKKTTDDCYTPDIVYDAVADWVAKEYNLKRENFIRPFYPGGDYAKENYKPEQIVVDNPPFSIFVEIVSFYIERGIRFFLFAPSLTILNYADKASCIALQLSVTYENGAQVPTSFLTNLEDKELALRTCPELYNKIKEADKQVRKEIKRELPKYSYPDNVITAAMAGKYSRYGIDLKIFRKDSVQIDALDEQKEQGKAIYGKGLLLSERAAAERAAAERRAAQKWELTERELKIVASLG